MASQRQSSELAHLRVRFFVCKKSSVEARESPPQLNLGHFSHPPGVCTTLFTEKKTAPGRIPGEKCSMIDAVDAVDETDAQRRPQKKKRVQ